MASPSAPACRPLEDRTQYGWVMKHTIAEFKFIFKQLFCFQLFAVPLLRFPYRVCALASGDFIKSGYRKAEKAWELKKQAWTLAGAPPQNTPSKHIFHADIVKNVTWHFIKNVAKIVTMPLATVASLFICIYGMFDPLRVYPLYGKIELAYSRDPIHLRPKLDEGDPKIFRLAFMEVIAPCMQPKDVWYRHNFYNRSLDDYFPIHDAVVEIYHLLQENPLFFANEGLNVDTLKQEIDLLERRTRVWEEMELLNIVDRICNHSAAAVLKEYPPEHQATHKLLSGIIEQLNIIKDNRNMLYTTALYLQSDHQKQSSQTKIDEAKARIPEMMRELDALCPKGNFR